MGRRRIFVVGATGYTGAHLVELAASRGLEVTAHLRPESSCRARVETRWRKAGVALVVCPLSTEALRPSLLQAAPDSVFALLGTTRARERASQGRDTYARVDLGLTLIVLEACQLCAPSARFVYLSAAGVTQRSRRGYYGARAAVEAALRASEQPSTILRPSFITGPDRLEHRPAERLAASVASSVLGLARGLGARATADRWAPLCGREVAHALLEASLDPALEGAVLEGQALRALLSRGERKEARLV